MAIGGVYPDKLGRRGVWRVVFYDMDGARRERIVPAESRRAALDLWKALAGRAQRERLGLERRAERVTVDEYWRLTYWPAVERGEAHAELAEKTASKRARLYAAHVRPIWGARKLGELSTAVINEGMGRLTRKGVSAAALSGSTRYGIERILCKLAHHAASRGYYGPEAMAAENDGAWHKPWKSPKKPRGKPRDGLTLEESARAIRAAYDLGGVRLAAAITLAAHAGVRRDELAWIERARVSEEGGIVSVHLVKTKNNEEATVALAGELGDLVSAQARAAAKVGGRWLFALRTDLRSRGRVIARRGDRQKDVVRWETWTRIRERAEIPKGRWFHDARRGFIQASGRHMSQHETQELARHKDGEVTERYLRAQTTDTARRAAKKLAAEMPRLELSLGASDAHKDDA